MPVRFSFQQLPFYSCLPLLLIACGGNATAPESAQTSSGSLPDSILISSDDAETSSAQSSDSQLFTETLAVCAARLNTTTDQLSKRIEELTGKTTPVIVVDPIGSEGLHTLWSSDGDVLCPDTPASEGGINLFLSVGAQQILFGSAASEYVAQQSGGFIFGGDGNDIVATLSGGEFYGEAGNDRVDSPVSALIYDGWTFAAIESLGATGGQFVGGDGNDHIGALNGAEFYGDDGSDTVLNLLSGTFYGGDGRDAVADPTQIRLGNMSGGSFYGEGGDDWVEIASGGTILGGEGDDIVHSMTSGKFEGMTGNDAVYSLVEDGIFSGGAGNDAVDSMNQGTYDGGADSDSLQVYTDGTVVNVEAVPDCLQSAAFTAHSRCLAGSSL
ncbi:hypothetical protein Q4485_08445 [Granulosicoccaceae sp. 1_MG-2023]|nr:hypothetical protein [Granulosicoccaceae sp. 1_MG-2023]